MQNTQEKRIEIIKSKLMKFLDPKPEYSGLMAQSLAQRLYEIATSDRLCRKCGDSVQTSDYCDHCQDQSYSFNQ